jgi:hypothetical protein
MTQYTLHVKAGGTERYIQQIERINKSTEKYKVTAQMCLIFKYLHCLKLCVDYFNKTFDRSFICGSNNYKVCFPLLYTFLFHPIKSYILWFRTYRVTSNLNEMFFGTKHNLPKCMFSGLPTRMTQKLQPLYAMENFFQSTPLLKQPTAFVISGWSTPLEESTVPCEITITLSYYIFKMIAPSTGVLLQIANCGFPTRRRQIINKTPVW